MNKIQDYFDSLAPHWDDKEMYPRSRQWEVLSNAGIQEGEEVLDLACGTGVITPLLFEASKRPVYALDLSSKMIEEAEKKYGGDNRYFFDFGDFLTYEFPKRFDVVVIYNAYPHFVDVDGFLDKLRKVLKPKGRVAILHSMSAEKLSAHHKNVDPTLFREIPSFKEESKRYEEHFDILKIEESDHVALVARLK